MADERRTYVVKKRDLADIIHLEDAGALEVFLQNPLAVIARATVEFFSHGPKALVGPGVRVVQGALKGNLFKRLAVEVEDLRKREKSMIISEGESTDFRVGLSFSASSTRTRPTKIGSRR